MSEEKLIKYNCDEKCEKGKDICCACCEEKDICEYKCGDEPDYKICESSIKVSGPTLDQWAEAIHKNAVDHGWWDEGRSFGDIVVLCHSELSEAIEAFRNGETLVWDNKGKPDGVAVEMADALIRILDWFGNQGISVEEVVAMKHEYNKSRPYKHGGKKI